MFTVGSIVEGIDDDQQYYTGTVMNVNPEGDYEIDFDDGDGEKGDELEPEDLPVLKREAMDLEPLSTEMLKQALERTIVQNSEGVKVGHVKVLSFKNVGEGCVLVSSGSRGSVVVLWGVEEITWISICLFTGKAWHSRQCLALNSKGNAGC